MKQYIMGVLCSILYVFFAIHAVFFVYATIAYTTVAFVPAAIVYTIYFIIQLVADEAHQQWMYLLFKIGCHRCHCNRCIYIRTRYVCVQALYHWRKNLLRSLSRQSFATRSNINLLLLLIMSAINITPVGAPAVYPDHNKTTDDNNFVIQFTLLVYLIVLPAMFVMASMRGRAISFVQGDTRHRHRHQVVTQDDVEGDLADDEELGSRSEVNVDVDDMQVEEEKTTVDAAVMNANAAYEEFAAVPSPTGRAMMPSTPAQGIANASTTTPTHADIRADHDEELGTCVTSTDCNCMDPTDAANAAYEKFIAALPPPSPNDYEEATSAAANELFHHSVYEASRIPKKKVLAALESSGVPSSLIHSKESRDKRLLSELCEGVKQKVKQLKPQAITEAARKRQLRAGATKAGVGCALTQDPNDVSTFLLGPMDEVECVHCGALGFAGENQGSSSKPHLGSMCCRNNKINVPVANDFNLDPYIKHLLTSDSKEAKYFQRNSRMFNSGMAMASVATEKGGWGRNRGKSGMYSAVRVSGQLVRRIGPMLPRNGVKPKFMQTYFFEPDEATAHRISNFENIKQHDKKLAERIFRKLHNALRNAGNTYINDCYAVKEYVEKNYPDGVDDVFITIHTSDKPDEEDMKIGLKRTRSGTHRGRLTKPKMNEVSILFPNEATGHHERQVVFNLKQPPDGGGVKRVRDDHRSYDPLSYPLFFNR